MHNEISAVTVIDFGNKLKTGAHDYRNLLLCQVNDHVVRMSIMSKPYYWHYHPNSDETFLVIEGSIFIDLETHTIELSQGQLFSIPTNVKHRTRPKGSGRLI